MNLDSFIKNISPKNSLQISISWDEIRKTIIWKSSVISSSFLTWSYIRHTKIDPIDDLDIFFSINFTNTQMENTTDGIKIYISPSSNYDGHQLKNFSVYDSGKYYISPIKLINYIWRLVKESYVTTNEQSRNGECYTIYLSSKRLTIDCIPYTGVSGEDYKLIPMWWNNMYWKKTNPKIDEEKINELNNIFNWKLKWIVKLMKWWNKNQNTWIKFKSYILECLVYYTFKTKCNSNMSYLELLKSTVDYFSTNVIEYRNIYDLPKYEHMHYQLDTSQRTRIISKLKDFKDNINIGEFTTVSYLSN